jgi:hypothetical protein
MDGFWIMGSMHAVEINHVESLQDDSIQRKMTSFSVSET